MLSSVFKIASTATGSVLAAQQLWQLGEVRRHAAGLVAGQQLGR